MLSTVRHTVLLDRERRDLLDTQALPAPPREREEMLVKPFLGLFPPLRPEGVRIRENIRIGVNEVDGLAHRSLGDGDQKGKPA